MYLAAKLPERTGSYNKRHFGDLSDAVMVWEPATESYDSVQSSQTAHEISYEIGRIDGIAVVLERLSQTMPDQNEFNKIMEAVYQREPVKKILDYMYDNPHIQHKTLANAIGLKPSYLSQLLRTLEEYSCVVRYEIDRRSFFDLSLGGQTFIKKKRAGTQ